MTQVCRQCSRVNPRDAAYCYYDGVPLAGQRSGGPIRAGSQSFPRQFVFPSGQVCKNFDQLALACQEHWPAAVDMLKQGFLGTFFGGLGRADLALAAMEAAKFPDIDRGLDQLLAKLPTAALEPPKLKAEPTVINLGEIRIGAEHQIELHLQNLGMRLCYGSVSSDAKWLTLGDPPGSDQKLFQFGSETAIPINIRGQFLRAGTKPLEGHLLVESNGGMATVTLRADVPVTPFPDEGIFQGALTPRQVAERAKADPKTAAPFFESGAVSRWFASNGWIYPVQGPTVSGLGGVQQFFEALGLARAPKVEISAHNLALHGEAGESLKTHLEMSTQEKKVVYGFAVCDQPWVDCSKVKLLGRTAKITVLVPRVPDCPGETLEAKITVHANGAQKFTVPVTLTIGGALPGPPPESGGVEPLVAAAGTAAAGLVVPDFPEAGFAAPGVVEPAAAVTTTAGATANEAHAAGALAAEPGPPPLISVDGGLFAFDDETPAPADPSAPTPTAVIAPMPPPSSAAVSRAWVAEQTGSGADRPFWLHLTPAILLGLALLGVLIYDLIGGPHERPGADAGIDPTPRLQPYFDWADKEQPGIGNTMSFGLAMLDPNDRSKVAKRLTFDLRGHTNSAVAWIDKHERLFGTLDAGQWRDRPKPIGKYGGRTVTFLYTQEQIAVTQSVEIIPGETIEVFPDVYKRLLDTCLIRWTLRNRDQKTHKVGFRFLLDTLIGGNDGCPFTIPGSTKLVATCEDFNPADPKNGKPVPDFIQAIETDNLRRPGTIAQVNLRLGDRIEPPSRVSLTQWPGGDAKRRYEVRVDNMDGDSALVLYWRPADLEPGKTREIGFSYGLGDVQADDLAKIGLTVGGALVVSGDVAVVALIADPRPGQTATIDVPTGMKLLKGHEATQPVPIAGEKLPDGRLRAAPVTWRLRAEAAGNYPITVRTSDNHQAQRRITIKRSSIF